MDENKESSLDAQPLSKSEENSGKSATLKTKAQVFLSYHKWYVLIALFFVVTITIMVVQTCTREKYDISVMYAGNAIFGDQQSADIEQVFEKLGKDGEKAVLYELVIMSDTELAAAYDAGHSPVTINMEKIRKNRETFSLNVMSDEFFILLLSPECYDIMALNGTLEKLDDIGVAVGNSDVRYNEYAIKLHSLGYARTYTAFSVLPQDTLLCFKKISELNADNEDKLEKRAHDIAFLKKLADYNFLAPSADSTAVILPKRKEYA